ncbi:hypothetical protein OJF2_14890 [Aquisphaera giovannonii]|uniref:Cytosine permease n=1 Tax=Aquisphaera giovannonii TaxID=406548 RepID=A0A5B9VYD1_9BACT|nr:hypothetical protein [Aquisphaera giovannonii]QEH32997.1 hypothetical protein OJF2_14890 [Aquisphaera giovannonii]
MSDIPPILRDELSRPAPERRGWRWTIAPAYASLFIWIPLLDPVGGLVGRGAEPFVVFLAAIPALLACVFLLYYPAAILGFQSGRGIAAVTSATLGTTGSEWIVGVLGGLGGLLVYAMSIDSAVRLTMLGLMLCGLVGPASLQGWSVGPVNLGPPISILTAAFWIYVTGTAILLRLASVVRAMMQVYTPVAIALVGVTALLTFRGLVRARFDPHAAVMAMGVEPASPVAAGLLVAQLLGCAFAFSGLLGADWGRSVRDRLDLLHGARIGILGAGWFAMIAVPAAVAGALGTDAAAVLPPKGAPPLLVPGTYHAAIYGGIGGTVGGAILMLLGLATLAPACYAIWLFGQRLAHHSGVLRLSTWTWIGGALALALIATGFAGDSIFLLEILGALFTPVAGTLFVEMIRSGGELRGIRPGINPAGLVAWIIGLAVGLIPTGQALFLGEGHLGRLQPACFLAFAAAAATYAILSAAGWEAPLAAIPDAPAEEARPPAAPL